MSDPFLFLSTRVNGLVHHADNLPPGALHALRPGEALRLAREPQNEHDPNALRVDLADPAPGYAGKLGYIPAPQAAWLATLVDAGYPLTARVRRVDWPHRPRLGDELPTILLDLYLPPWPRPVIFLDAGAKVEYVEVGGDATAAVEPLPVVVSATLAVGPLRPAAEVPAALEDYYARVGEIELPGEAVAVWIRHRGNLAALPEAQRQDAWKALCAKTEEIGRMRNAKVWLKKAIAEEDARREARGRY